ncbi:Alpha/Beta hydrolase protein [Collybia nuda]|uniref:Alpha/Beta hydrolase protein n=1 Tax=Collybia nuda TaxID=64659 RepID=A0A9P6CC47_9AGAR|nr:Alpha/Beta hydrolase protein [Collybia nuda]
MKLLSILLAYACSALFIAELSAAAVVNAPARAPDNTTAFALSGRVENMCPTRAPIPKAIRTNEYEDLIKYYKYAYAAYSEKCLFPNQANGVRVTTSVFNNTVIYGLASGAGYIAVDDTKREYIIAYHGTKSVNDTRDDLKIGLRKFSVAGITVPKDVRVHEGFRDVYFRNDGHNTLINLLTKEFKRNPGYSIVTTGHSLGGAVASIAGVILRRTLKVPVKIYTYGQPRTGNAAYAQWVEDGVDLSNIFRSVNRNDPFPHVPTTLRGYMHHGTEYWTCGEGNTAADTRECSLPEQPNCSRDITTATPDIGSRPHRDYFGLPGNLEFCDQRRF